ncbi:MAG: GIY-YIG nuclease family protein [Chitinophagales bacterium]
MFYVYILYSDKYDSFYIGYSSDLEKRINQHNNGETKSTKSKIPWRIVYTEEYDNKLEAIRRERFLKAQKNKSFYKKLCEID